MYFDDWIVGNSIGRVPLIFIRSRGGLIQLKNQYGTIIILLYKVFLRFESK